MRKARLTIYTLMTNKEKNVAVESCHEITNHILQLTLDGVESNLSRNDIERLYLISKHAGIIFDCVNAQKIRRDKKLIKEMSLPRA